MRSRQTFTRYRKEVKACQSTRVSTRPSANICLQQGSDTSLTGAGTTGVKLLHLPGSNRNQSHLHFISTGQQ